jgi:hypothetical protein
LVLGESSHEGEDCGFLEGRIDLFGIDF